MFEIKEILWEQLEYLYECSKCANNTKTDVVNLTMAMIELVKTIKEI